MKRLLILFLILILCTPALAEQDWDFDETIMVENYFFGREGDEWRLYALDGEVLIDHVWSDADFRGGFSHPFSGFDGAELAPIRFGSEQSSTYGCINREGEIVVEPKYDFIYSFSCGVACVQLDGKYGYIDETGATVLQPTLDGASPFHDDRGCIQIDGKYGFVDASGSIVIEPQYDYVSVGGFQHSACSVWKDGLCALIDTDGNCVIPAEYDNITVHSEYAATVTRSGLSGLVTLQNEILLPVAYDSIYSTDDGLFAAVTGSRREYYSLEADRLTAVGTVQSAVNAEDYRSGKAMIPSLDSEATLQLNGDPAFRLDSANTLFPLCTAVSQAVGADCSAASADADEAILRLIEGKTDLVLAYTPDETQLAMAAEAGVELDLTLIGHQALAFVTAAENPVENVPSADLRAVFAGEITDWTDLGGSGKIAVYQHPAFSDCQRALERFMGGLAMLPAIEDYAVFGFSWDDDGGNIAQYRNYPESIGCTLMSLLPEAERGSMKLLTIDGAAPTSENVLSGAYPAAVPVYAVTLKGSAAALTAWLQGIQGAELMTKCGLIPAGSDLPVENLIPDVG